MKGDNETSLESRATALSFARSIGVPHIVPFVKLSFFPLQTDVCFLKKVKMWNSYKSTADQTCAHTKRSFNRVFVHVLQKG